MVLDKRSPTTRSSDKRERRKGKAGRESGVNSILGGAGNLAAGHGSRTKKGDVKSNYANSRLVGCDATARSVYPVGLAKFTVKRGAANKLSIRRGIALVRPSEGRATQKRCAKLREWCACAPRTSDARYRRSVTR